MQETFNDPRLNPCPICGGGKTNLRPILGTWSGTRPQQLIGVEVYHWCEKVDDPFITGFIKMRCRDEDDAITRWNNVPWHSTTKEA